VGWVGFGELRVHVGFPIEHADQVVEVLVELRLDVFDEEIPRDDAAFDLRLEHGEDVAVNLRLISDERARSVEDTRINLPSAAWLKPVGTREQKDAIVAAVPVLEAAAEVGLGGAGLQTHVGVGEVIVELVVLGREVVGLGLALVADEVRDLVALVHVVGNRPHVVEKLAE